MSRVLFLTSHLPYPPVSGGRRREYELLRRLAANHEIFVCAVSKTYEADLANLRRLAAEVGTVRLFPAIDVMSLPEAVRDSQAHPLLRNSSAEAKACVREWLEEEKVDLVHAEGFFMMPLVPPFAAVPILTVEQTIEHRLELQRASLHPDSRRWHLRQAAMLLHSEQAAWRRSSLCALLSEDDRGELLRLAPGKPTRLIPDGADHDTCIDSERKDDPSMRYRPWPEGTNAVLFVGNFAYGPNQDAGEFLCREIAPRIWKREANTILVIVGNGAPDAMRRYACERVVVRPRVSSLEPYYDSAAVVTCPLRIGGGVKVKMLEALRRGKAIVSTSVGLQGIGDARMPAPVRLADDPDQFADQVIVLLRDSAGRRSLERAAVEFARKLPTWNEAARSLEACYSELLAATRPANRTMLD
jgi:glycosyltransferase involved in cell wall biosynthesis